MNRSAGEELLQEVQQTYIGISSMQARFEQESYLASLDISETSSGTMIFKKPGKMKWTYEDPEPQLFLLNDNVVYLYQPKEHQVVIDEFKKILLTDLPVSFVMGIGDLSKDFKILGACTGPDGVVLTLHAQRGNAELKELKLLVSPATKMTIGGKVVDKSGNVTAVVFRDLKKNVEFTEKDFKPEFPKGIDITDRRRGDG